jgi:cytidine deaminase
MCRQFLREFIALETPIFMFNKQGKYIVRTMGELLPLSFGPDVLPPRESLRKAQEEDKAKDALGKLKDFPFDAFKGTSQ